MFVAIALSVNFVNHQKKVRERGQEYAAKAIAAMMIEKKYQKLFWILRN